MEQFYPAYEIDSIAPSPTNPRKVFKDIADLAASLKSVGVLQPLVARPAPDAALGLELVCGERRLRAAREAELETVPVMVRDLTDAQVLEIQLIENNQRSDVHPMEEAESYRRLLDAVPGMTVADIAGKIGRDLPYVTKRLNLLNLVEPLRMALDEEKIDLTKAVYLARLQPAQQEEVAEELNDEYGGLQSFADLKDWVEREIFRDLTMVAFPIHDAELVPEAGSCVSCLKRAGAQAALFDDVQNGDTCSDPVCFEAKSKAHIARERARIQAEEPDVLVISGNWSRPGEKGLPCLNDLMIVDKPGRGVVEAFVVEGTQAGERVLVRPRGEAGAGGALKERAKEQRAQEKQKFEEKVTAKAAEAALEQLCGAAVDADFEFLLQAAVVELSSHVYGKKLAALREILPFKPVSTKWGRERVAEGVLRHFESLDNDHGSRLGPLLVRLLAWRCTEFDLPEAVERMCRSLGVDFAAVKEQVRGELTAAAKQKLDRVKAKQKAAAKKSGKAKKVVEGAKPARRRKSKVIEEVDVPALNTRLANVTIVLERDGDRWGAAVGCTAGIGKHAASIALDVVEYFDSREAAVLEAVESVGEWARSIGRNAAHRVVEDGAKEIVAWSVDRVAELKPAGGKSGPAPGGWPQPSEFGVYDDDAAERIEMPALKKKGPTATIVVLQVVDGKWISAASGASGGAGLGHGGFSEPLQESLGYFSFRNAAIKAAAQRLASRARANGAPAVKEWKAIAEWAEGLVENPPAAVEAERVA